MRLLHPMRTIYEAIGSQSKADLVTIGDGIRKRIEMASDVDVSNCLLNNHL